MSESSLSLTRTELKVIVGRYLGYGTDSSLWTGSKAYMLSDVNRAIDSGLREFYHPPVLPGERTAHRWTFLQPLSDISISTGQSSVKLPDDFSAFVEPTLKFYSSDSAWFLVPLTSIGRILAARQAGENTSQPEMVAVVPLQGDGGEGQRFAIEVWPTVSSDFTIRAPYYFNPNAITDSKPYPLGGQPHSETLRESCLAAAEAELNDTMEVHRARFLQRLITSVSIDRQSMGAHLGYNGDRSGENFFPYNRQAGNLTYNGVSYGS